MCPGVKTCQDISENHNFTGRLQGNGVRNQYYGKKGRLVGGLEPWNFMTFHSVGNVIIPTDSYFSEG